MNFSSQAPQIEPSGLNFSLQVPQIGHQINFPSEAAKLIKRIEDNDVRSLNYNEKYYRMSSEFLDFFDRYPFIFSQIIRGDFDTRKLSIVSEHYNDVVNGNMSIGSAIICSWNDDDKYRNYYEDSVEDCEEDSDEDDSVDDSVEDDSDEDDSVEEDSVED